MLQNNLMNSMGFGRNSIFFTKVLMTNSKPINKNLFSLNLNFIDYL